MIKPIRFLAAIILLSLFSAFVLPANAADIVIVVPNSLTSVEGNTNSMHPFDIAEVTPTITAERYQQIYDASQFSALPPGGAYLTKIAFRVGASGSAFSATLPYVTISLASAQKTSSLPMTAQNPGGLSTTFADNGYGYTTVFDGPLTLNSAATGVPTKAFDIVITLTKPFFYDPGSPAKTNLLLDLTTNAINSAVSDKTTPFDANSDPAGVISSVFGDMNSPTAQPNNLRSLGLVTQFTFGTPAPTAPKLISITVTPADVGVCTNQLQQQLTQFTATGNYDDGSTKDLTASVTWSCSNLPLLPLRPPLATINGQGKATVSGNIGDQCTIIAMLGSVSGSAHWK